MACLEVVGQLGAASITRVHGDADVAVGVQLQLGPFKDELLHVGLHSSDDAQDLNNARNNLVSTALVHELQELFPNFLTRDLELTTDLSPGER